jgi:hypothetical protein
MEKFSLAGMEALSLSLDQTQFSTLNSLLETKEYQERLSLLRNRLGLGFVL